VVVILQLVMMIIVRTTMSRLAVDIDTARKNLNSHDWVAVDMHDSLCKKCNGSILNVTLVFNCDELSDD